MDRKEYDKEQDVSLYSQGRRLALKSASVGCIIFGFLYLVIVYVNTFIVQRIDAPFDLFTVFFFIIATIIITLIAIAVSYFPAGFMGGRLANALEADAHNHTLSERRAIVKGAQFGAAAACMICLPILVLQFLFVTLTMHGEIIPGLFLSFETIVIASIAGAWTGKQLERLIMKSNTA